MRNDYPYIFRKPQFRELLAKYESMKAEKWSVYFEENDLMLLAEYYANACNMKASKEVIDYALRLHPESLDILLFKCHDLIADKQFDEASSLLNSLPDQTDYEVLLLRAELYLELKHTAEAEEILHQLYEDDDSIETILDITQTYMDASYQEKAEHWLRKAQKKQPDHPEVMDLAASLHYSKGDMKKAAELYNKLLDGEPYADDYWLNLAFCYLQMNEFSKALEAADFVLAIDESNLTALEVKGNCYMFQEQSGKALECFQEIERKAQSKTHIWEILMSYYFNQPDYGKALEYSEKLLSEKKEEEVFHMPDLYYQRALSHLYLDKPEACAEDIQKGLEYDGYHSGLYLASGELCLSHEKLNDASYAFDTALHYAYSPEETLENIAFAYFRWNYLPEALNVFKKLEEKDPERMQNDYYVAAFCCYRTKQKHDMLMYIVKGAYYAPEAISTLDTHNLSKTEDKEFFDLCRSILQKIQEGTLNPARYLGAHKNTESDN